jgi:hypothetical protein
VSPLWVSPKKEKVRVLYQPTQQKPGDWLQVDAGAWASTGSFKLHALCIQGVVIDGADRYSVETVSPGVVRAICWYDDPDDWPAGMRWAREITFRHLSPSTDPRFGGAINTHQTQVIYAEAGIAAILRPAYAGPGIAFRDWADFDPSVRINPLDGVWVSDAHHAAHRAVRSVRGWREWSEGLDPAELDSGRLRPQRALGRYEMPKGTRTYYHNGDNATPTGIHSVDFENELGLTAGGSTDQAVAVGGNGILVAAGSTPSGEPNNAAWPTTGVYRCQIDVAGIGADLTCGLLTQGSADGHFARVNSGLTSELQTFVQDQSAFSGSGLKLASVTNPSWSAGDAADRFEVLLAAVRATGHGNQGITVQLGEVDDFCDGPWPAAALPSDNSIFFGCNF